MLKISKGLKKKKKSKKNKHKEEELFTEEELEKYRKEHSQQVEEYQGENSEGQKTKTSEEFEKFKLLTAGVDDILRKSQGDLDRIKKESFFQRKLTPSEIKAQEDKEKEELRRTSGNWTDFEDKNQTEESKKPLEEQKDEKEESESESEYDDKDDIFDTTYVEALESGAVKLVYVPEDDDIVKEGEPDPFDTSTAEEILKKVEEEEEKKKLQISLNLAVQVLTGRADRDKVILEEIGAPEVLESISAPKPKKRPRKIQDVVLIGSFDEEKSLGFPPSEPIKETEPVKSLLDDDINAECELPEGNALLTEITKLSANKGEQSSDYKENNTNLESNNLKDLVNEFDLISAGLSLETKKVEEIKDDFDEFTALAVSSVANQKLEEELRKFEDSEDDPFDTSSANLILKEQSDPFGNIDPKVSLPEITKLPFENNKWLAFQSDQGEEEIEVDPFDTSFAEKIQPGKCELKLLENEILGDLIESAHRSDIHQEARILSRNNSDSDFKPTAEISSKLNNQNFYSKVSIQITDPSGIVEVKRGSESEAKEEDLVTLSFKHRDLLGGSTTDLTKLGNDPLPPEVESPLENFSKYSDPFDTTIVDKVVIPGKAELKFLENELLSDIKKSFDEDNLSDKDFDPRKEEEISDRKVSFDISSTQVPNLLTKEVVRPLTPFYTEAKDNDLDIGELDDPFDTSHVISLPGKEELKIIEKELDNIHISEIVSETLYKKLGISETLENSCTGLKHSLSDPDFNPRGEEADQNLEVFSNSKRRFSEIQSSPKQPPSYLHFKTDLLRVEEEHSVKALTPAVEKDISNYIDPFDTSIADNLVPGKTELKLLESELITNLAAEEGIKRSYTDPDFNPRESKQVESTLEVTPQTDILDFQESSVINIKPLTSVDFEVAKDEFDPFDTSIATNLIPGKAELRVLESELFG